MTPLPPAILISRTVTIPALNALRNIDIKFPHRDSREVHEICLFSVFFKIQCPQIIFLSRNTTNTMVQKGYCPFTAATEACRRRKRGGKGKTVTCFSPWSVISCWFHLGRWKGGNGMNLEELGSYEDAENRIALGCLDPGTSNSALEVSGDHNKEASFSLGVGLGLIYLMATNKNEMSKLEELCKQMEVMLHNFKREFPHDQRNDANINTSHSTPKRGQAFSNYPINDDRVSVHDYPFYSWEQENSESDFTSSSCQNSHSKVNRKGKRLLEMDQLEAELEAELEHLQLQLDDEGLSCYDQKNSEILIEKESEETMSTSFSEAIKKLDMENTKHQGVHPIELEKRLHELHEERQQERIKELELELSWWKDTARIVLQHSPQKTANLEDWKTKF